jgi:hypothetical protein
MKLRHATPSRNLASIRKRGLLTSKSQGKLPVVWLHAPGKTSWALLHVVKRHGERVEDVRRIRGRRPTINMAHPITPARSCRNRPLNASWAMRQRGGPTPLAKRR